MNRFGPFLLILAGLALASSDTLHVAVLPATTPEGYATIGGLLLSSLGFLWSHRNLARKFAGQVTQSVDVEELARAAATAAYKKFQEPGSDLSAIIAQAAAAAARDAGDQVVRHVQAAIPPAPAPGDGFAPVPRMPRESIEEIAGSGRPNVESAVLTSSSPSLVVQA